MCTSGNSSGNWQKDYPQVEGDYLWVLQWSCGCVIKSGIAWVHEVEVPSKNSYKNKEGDLLEISWEGQLPDFVDGKPIVDYWLAIELPPVCEDPARGLSKEEDPSFRPINDFLPEDEKVEWVLKVNCIYCGNHVTLNALNGLDDLGWEKLAKEHKESCIWIKTRAGYCGLLNSTGGGPYEDYRKGSY